MMIITYKIREKLESIRCFDYSFKRDFATNIIKADKINKKQLKLLNNFYKEHMNFLNAIGKPKSGKCCGSTDYEPDISDCEAMSLKEYF
jgi:hypothetical protein